MENNCEENFPLKFISKGEDDEERKKKRAVNVARGCSEEQCYIKFHLY